LQDDKALAEQSRAIYDQQVAEWDDAAVRLFPAERTLLERFRGRWPTTRMLDLGIGAGRTAFVFSAIAEHYVGIDYSSGMIAAARRALTDDDRRQIKVGDARHLEDLADASFDVVLFSFNGIDHVPADDRATVLREIHRVLRPGGTLLFSSHCLRVLTPTYCQRSLRARLRFLRDNGWDFHRRAKGQPIMLVRELGHTMFYVDPVHQRQQLIELGFEPGDIVDRRGQIVPVDKLEVSTRERHWWLYYFATAGKILAKPQASGEG